MEVIFDSFSLPGRQKENQDSLIVGTAGDLYYFAIADGMGGAKGGEVASTLAMETIASIMEQNPSSDFKKIFSQIHQRLIAEANKNEDLQKMGTTLTICLLDGNQLEVGHVGDSRAYLLRGNGLKTLTKDQTEVQKLIEEGVLSHREAKRYPRRNVLLSVLSPSSNYELYEYNYILDKNDRLLILTDGVYNVLSKQDIKDISVNEKSVDSFIEKLKEAVEDRKVKDDYSAVAIDLR